MKKAKVIFWITTFFLFLFEGMMPLFTVLLAPEYATPGVLHLNYPAYFAYLLINLKVIGSILLIIPRLPRAVREWTYAGFGFNFILASVSHFIIDGPQVVSFFPLLMLGILTLSYVYFFKAYPHGQNRLSVDRAIS